MFFFLICIKLYLLIESYSVRIEPGLNSCFLIKTIVGVPITGSYEVILPDPDYISGKLVIINKKKFY